MEINLLILIEQSLREYRIHLSTKKMDDTEETWIENRVIPQKTNISDWISGSILVESSLTRIFVVNEALKVLLRFATSYF